MIYALITGANRGIGLSVAQALSAKPNFFILLGVRDVNSESSKEALSTIKTNNAALLPLDVTSDDSILAAVEIVKTNYGRLDVLINNAGIAAMTTASDPLSSQRKLWTSIFNTNITSVALLTSSFLPLLSLSNQPKLINVSSTRGSITRSSNGSQPPSVVIPYSVSKAALNFLTVEQARANPGMEVNCVSPGHCKTAFNGYRGKKSPEDGAKVIVELAVAPRETFGSGGFWEAEGENGVMSRVEW